jgi:hypothetical protein
VTQVRAETVISNPFCHLAGGFFVGWWKHENRACRLNTGELYIHRQEARGLPVITYGLLSEKDISQKETQHEIRTEDIRSGCDVQRIGV